MPNPMRYPTEQFSDEERALLAPHFTNLDRPVFALVNLPETVKGALFARYSRYSGGVRRLYLDEFAADDETGAALCKLDGFLCELKDLQIRDGLHVLGESPEGERLDQLLLVLARARRG